MTLTTIGGTGCAKPAGSNAEGTEASTTSTSADADTCGAWTDLATMDPRTPVPLQPMMAFHQKQNMQAHLQVVERITAALAQQDFAVVAEAAKAIEPSPSMTQQCNHMGAGASGFTPMALAFHDTARGIGEAAAKEDTQAVLAAMSDTLKTCTACHSQFRQEVVTASVWEERTGQASPSRGGSMHGGGHGQGGGMGRGMHG